MTRASFGITTAFDILKAILDLDPDLCQNFPYFVTFVDSAHRNMYDTSK